MSSVETRQTAVILYTPPINLKNFIRGEVVKYFASTISRGEPLSEMESKISKLSDSRLGMLAQMLEDFSQEKLASHQFEALLKIFKEDSFPEPQQDSSPRLDASPTEIKDFFYKKFIEHLASEISQGEEASSETVSKISKLSGSKLKVLVAGLREFNQGTLTLDQLKDFDDSDRHSFLRISIFDKKPAYTLDTRPDQNLSKVIEDLRRRSIPDLEHSISYKFHKSAKDTSSQGQKIEFFRQSNSRGIDISQKPSK